jgi:hypothetical protein
VAAALCVAASCVAASAAAAAEHVNDGGFEAAACNATDCTDPAWADSSTSAFAFGIGPICRSGVGTGTTACTAQGSAPFSGSTWARLGAGDKVAEPMSSGGISSSLVQAVSIPTAPATLSFRLRIIDVAVAIGELTVEVGGAQVFTATDTTPGFAASAPVTIDVSSFAGTAPMLRLDGFSSRTSIGMLDSFDVDEISVSTVEAPLATADPRCAKLRAKLKKAKNKKQKHKIRKLRKRMRALGC